MLSISFETADAFRASVAAAGEQLFGWLAPTLLLLLLVYLAYRQLTGGIAPNDLR